jgi:ribonuclease P protein component
MRLPAVKIRANVLSLVRSSFYKNGQYVAVKRLKCDGDARFIISASRKCGNAVFRNRVRRIVREWLRKNYGAFPQNYYWMIRFLPTCGTLSKAKLSIVLRTELVELFGGFGVALTAK